MTTDSDGHADHSDTRYYDYSKTYCTGHPEPELVECDHEEECGCDAENERRMKLWEAECAACEESTDFHDVDGNGLQMMIADRDQTYQDFINLEYEYTVEETQARNGYILHGKHNDDDPIETITTASSETGGSGRSRMSANTFSDTQVTASDQNPHPSYQMRGLPAEWNPASLSIELPTPVELSDLDEVRSVTGCDPIEIELDSENDENENKESKAASPSNSEQKESEETVNKATDSNSLSQSEEEAEEPEELETDRIATVSISARKDLVIKEKRATGSDSEKNIKGTSSEADPEEEEEEEEEEELQEDDGELINDLPFSYTLHSFAGGSVNSFTESRRVSGPAALLNLDKIMALSDDDDDDDEEITVTAPEPIEDNEPPVTPGPSDNLLYTWEVYDHRTEGELHINKRDLELYQDDQDGSHGQTQGDATLEGTVYGLYAADDIIHPDGKTGTVFKRNDLVAIATTDQNGDASFLAITEVSDTSKAADNLAHTWIGHPLILGNYYVKEIARSEGYELSVSGIKELDTNRTGAETVIAENGTATASQLNHPIDNWDGSWNDFTVSSRGTTDGYDITVTGYPEGSKFYRVDMKTSQITEQVVIGSHLEVKKDALGNTLYKKAEGGEYKIGPDGNYIVQTVASSSEAIPDTSRPYTETFAYTYRLNYYPTGTATPTVDPSKWANTSVVDEAYLKAEINSMLKQLKYKSLDNTDGDGAPWINLSLSGTTNAQLATEILDWYAAHDFWDCAQVESIYTKNGQRYARLFYDYTGLVDQAFYDSKHGDLYVKKAMDVTGGATESHYWLCYPKADFKLSAYAATVAEKKEIPAGTTVAFGEDFESLIKTVYQPLYETYAPGDLILDLDGNPIPETEEVFDYETQTYEAEIEDPVLITATYQADQGTYTIHVPNTVDWSTTTGTVETNFRAQAPLKSIITDEGEFMSYADYLTERGDAGVSVATTKKNLDSGTYIKTQVLVYPGQNRIYQDAGTRLKPIIVLQRIIKQAIKVTKDIAQESYDDVNTYKIHRDPFTVLFGGYNGSKGTKTLKNFFFRLYLKQDLIDTGQLERATASNATTEYNYEKLFKEHPEYSKDLAVEWDEPGRDKDGDLTTIHAEQGTGVDDYYGTSIPLPYGTYVLVEQQPTTIPTKHYKIDRPQEIILPFVPQTDPDGTIHENKESIEYFYDSELTPEQLTDRYNIRFNEETDVIRAHNNDGDFKIFKYGLEPDSKQDCGNATVAGYYKYSSTSEDVGTADGVYYETYVDRDGQAIDYGITLDDVATMTGKTTAIDRKYAQALVPWSVLKPIIGGVVNADGDIGNRLPEAPGGDFNFVSYANADMENMFFSSKIRIEKLDHETGENILHDGALFKIYAAKRDITGVGTTGVTGTGNVIFDADGNPVYDENELIKMQDKDGNEVGIFKAYTTEREVITEPGKVEKQTVGYIETYQPLGAGVYVLVEVQPPEGYARSKPIAFEVYSDQTTYYDEGDPDRRVQATRYQYAKPVHEEDKYETYDVDQIKVHDYPSHTEIHKVEDGDQAIGDVNGLDDLKNVNDNGDLLTYMVEGRKEYLEARGDVEDITWNEDKKLYTGTVTKTYDEWSENLITGTEAELKEKENVKPLYNLDGTFSGKGIRFDIYVKDAELKLYKGIVLATASDAGYEGVNAEYDDQGRLTKIVNTNTGDHLEITKQGQDSGPAKLDEWDTEAIDNTPVNLYFYDLDETPTETDAESGELYVLDDRGNRICLADPVTGMAYVYDDYHRIIAYPVDEGGEKQLVQSIVVHSDGTTETIYIDKESVDDENGLPIYYKDWKLEHQDEIWTTPEDGPHKIARLPFGAYVVEESKVPYDQGYIQAPYLGLVLHETKEDQKFFLQNVFTKTNIAKIDITTKEEIPDAEMTLYDAVVMDDPDNPKGYYLEKANGDDGTPIVRASWISGYEYDDNGNLKLDGDGNRIPTTKPHWIDHLPVGFYILEETVVPHEWGYVQSQPIEIHALETGEVQTYYMEDDYTSIDVRKYDSKTGEVIVTDNPATLTLYKAKLDADGKPVMDDKGIPQYDPTDFMCRMQTGDGKDILATGREVTDEYGETYTVYDYDVQRIPTTKRGQYYITENGTLRIEYLPIGEYVLVEENAPIGYATADPILITCEETGHLVEIQSYEMADVPLTIDISKVHITGGKEVDGAELELYPVVNGVKAATPCNAWKSGQDGKYSEAEKEAGEIPDGFDVGDLKPHRIEHIPAGDYILVEKTTPYGFLQAVEIPFTVADTREIQKLEMLDEIPDSILKVYKRDKDNPATLLAGAHFELWNKTLKQKVQTVITDAAGYAETDPVPIGYMDDKGKFQAYRYEVKEVNAPEDYMLNVTPCEFEFVYADEHTPEVTYTYDALNEVNQVKISKLIGGTTKDLAGATIKVVEKSTGKVIDRRVTDGSPYYLKGLKKGTYLLIEEATPGPGYAPADPVEFTITSNMTEVKPVKMFDWSSIVEVVKADKSSGKAIGGARMKISTSSASNATPLDEWTSVEGEGHKLYGLDPGDYYVSELAAPSGYKPSEEVVKVTVGDTYARHTVTFNNEKRPGGGGSDGGGSNTPKPTVDYISFLKTNLFGEVLPGAEFAFYNQDGSLLATAVSNEKGVIRLKKPAPGTYTFKETKAPDGYFISDKTYSVTIASDGTISGDYKIQNTPSTNIVIQKLDGNTKEPLAGALIQIFNSDNEVVGEETTGEDGCFTFLPTSTGTYRIKEIQAPTGYQLNSGTYDFVAHADGSITGTTVIHDYSGTLPPGQKIGKVIATYHTSLGGKGTAVFGGLGKILRRYQTGDQTPFLPMIGLFLLCAGGVSFLLYRQRRKR